MDKTKEQLLEEINAFSENIAKKASLVSEISRLEAQNAGLQQELNNAPTEQTTYVEQAKKEVSDEAGHQDGKRDSKVNKLFITLTVILAIVNVALVYIMADKAAVVDRMQMVNMELFGNITPEQLVSMFPFLLVLAVVFQIAAIIGAIGVASSVTIGKR